jgi:hypothetical protein
MTEQRCKTCKWWGVNYVAPPPEFPDTDLYRHCDHEKLSYPPSDGNDGAYDVECYGGIDTGPEFGCIHWEEKQDA